MASALTRALVMGRGSGDVTARPWEGAHSGTRQASRKQTSDLYVSSCNLPLFIALSIVVAEAVKEAALATAFGKAIHS